ncbi:MAG: HAD family acid phosphatase [Marmoricola sp.]
MTRPVVLAVVAVLVALGLAVPGTALALGHGPRPVPPPPEHPTSADQIQNIGQVAAAIKAYYGDTVTDQVDPVTTDGKDVPLHTYGQDSAYVHEMAGIERHAERYLGHAGLSARSGTDAKKAILLDVDDTTLNTYSYEIYANFGYNPDDNAAFVNDAIFPEVPGMPELVKQAANEGYAVFFLTGRPDDQRPGTEKNLTDVGYPVVPNADPDNSDNVYLKGESKPWITCDTEGDAHCTTIERKSETRRHIERDLGYDIVANFGDQYSDLEGGYADRTVKLPNPMYYLP